MSDSRRPSSAGSNNTVAPTSLAAFVFDAYGTLFDVHAIAVAAEVLLPGQGAALSTRWRAKQLEYSWLVTLMEQRADFGAVTERALDYALASLGVTLPDSARQSLQEAWLSLPTFADAFAALTKLAGRPRCILSNGTRAMLAPLIAGSALATLIDGLLSAEDAGAFKPSPRVYALAARRFGVPPQAIGFVSANGWDVAGAKSFGFTTFWIDRTGFPVERHAAAPDHIVGSLAELADLVCR